MRSTARLLSGFLFVKCNIRRAVYLCERLHRGNQFPKRRELLSRHAADDAVLALAAKVVMDEDFPRIVLLEKFNEAAEEIQVHPIVLDLTSDVDGIAVTLETKPSLPGLDVHMIFNIREYERSLRHLHHSLRDLNVIAIILDALGIKMPEEITMRRPRRFLLRHPETHQGQIPTRFVERLPPLAFLEIRDAELVPQLQATSGNRIQLFFDGHSMRSSIPSSTNQG